METLKDKTREYIFDELCITCVKRVYIHCDYTHNRADEPQCVIGKTLKQAYLKGSEDADVLLSEREADEIKEKKIMRPEDAIVVHPVRIREGFREPKTQHHNKF